MATLEKDDEILEIPDVLPVLPLRDVVIFPGMVTPLLVGRAKSLASLDEAMKRERLMLVVTQKEMSVDEPTQKDLYTMGTVVKVLQVMRLVEGTMRILVEGLSRGEVKRFVSTKRLLKARSVLCSPAPVSSRKTQALVRSVSTQFTEYVQLNKRIPEEVLRSVIPIEDFDRLADSIAAHVLAKIDVKQPILEAVDLERRCRIISRVLAEELEILKIEKKIEGEVKSQVQKNQKEFYLHEQLKAIRKELGDSAADELSEHDELREKIEKAGMTTEAYEVAMKEFDRLVRMPALSPEATVVRNYLDTLISLPWSVRSEDHLDIRKVRKQLDADHYGLKKVKERIVEFLAVLKLSRSIKGPILCLVGPPGVGKTSLGRSIADALGRRFVRFSLGGVRDEAEIRGHRRTYIGSMPGRIIQSLIKAECKNPVMLLDEVDKMASDFRGDPAAALLEVLDPEQNHTFSDHFLEVEFDLSEIMFITTANVTHTIPPALQDRMETIRLPGYLETEKVKIAKDYLLPRMLDRHGLKSGNIDASDAAVRKIIQLYTRESGVRNLERELSRVLRRVAVSIASGKGSSVALSTKNLGRYLGIPHYTEKEIPSREMVGEVTGLAWTSSGGDILRIEVGFMPGTGKFSLTGLLGDTMKESAQIALSYARSLARTLPLKKNFFNEMDVHIHVPEGAIPKDGPSAGIAITTALVSNFFGIPVRKNLAMTGEITLKGEVLAVGGLNEKTVAALRAGVKELPKEVRQGLKIHTVSDIREVLRLALTRPLPRASRKSVKHPSELGFFEFMKDSSMAH
jgi:ATP-dependent Lon protease